VFSATAKAGANASAKENSAPGNEIPSKCWLCKGTPAISPTSTSALRAGTAFNEAGTVEVAGQVFALSVSKMVPVMCCRTVATLSRFKAACCTPAAPGA